MLQMVISGGQTGVDRAALYWHSRAGHCVAFVRRPDQMQDKCKFYLGGAPLARSQTEDVLKWE
jgi:hypothetical protein